ncbi:hypothetical protein NFC73_07490 [Pseudarthrobacter sp. RMG13]|uniref:Uncharacterized protein n=1 Tax=Pseudarthrobacter humi TaxID=2952523 RepID=A0ABT1LMB9_9MICC|nr:hypothetical protein [Pseudarthrobacter humi]MCP8999575.1 hypothetical protein [Pseudarthrobacter humi]
MFEDDEWLELVTELITATRAHNLKWMEQDDRVIALLGDSSYEIGSIDDDGRIPYFLGVRIREDGVVTEIARLESEPVVEDRPWTAGEKLPELRNLAFRSAKGAPEIFGKLLADLKGTAEPPF